MARLNPKRRALLKLQGQYQLVQTARALNDDSVKLQRGSPSTSSGSKFARNGTYATIAPRQLPFADYTPPTPTGTPKKAKPSRSLRTREHADAQRLVALAKRIAPEKFA